jgi:hypothetical protein
MLPGLCVQRLHFSETHSNRTNGLTHQRPFSNTPACTRGSTHRDQHTRHIHAYRVTAHSHCRSPLSNTRTAHRYRSTPLSNSAAWISTAAR